MLFMEISTHFKHFLGILLCIPIPHVDIVAFLKNAKHVGFFNVCGDFCGFMFQKNVVILQPNFNGELQKSLSIQDNKRQRYMEKSRCRIDVRYRNKIEKFHSWGVAAQI